MSKPELMKRRTDSIDRFNAQEKKLEEESKSKKYQLETKAVNDQMELERHQRKTIKHSMKAQLETAKDDLFKDLEEVNQADAKLLGSKKEAEKVFKIQLYILLLIFCG